MAGLAAAFGLLTYILWFLGVFSFETSLLLMLLYIASAAGSGGEA